MDSNAFENLSLFFKIILALLKILKVTPEYKGDSINTIRKKFAWNSEENLKHLFGIIDKDVMERTINDHGEFMEA